MLVWTPTYLNLAQSLMSVTSTIPKAFTEVSPDFYQMNASPPPSIQLRTTSICPTSCACSFAKGRKDQACGLDAEEASLEDLDAWRAAARVAAHVSAEQRDEEHEFAERRRTPDWIHLAVLLLAQQQGCVDLFA